MVKSFRAARDEYVEQHGVPLAQPQVCAMDAAHPHFAPLAIPYPPSLKIR